MDAWQVVELKARGPDDPEGLRTASVLEAYFNAQRACVFRQRLWRRLAVAGCVAWIVETTRLLPPISFAVALVLFAVAGAGARVIERRAQKTLRRLIDDSRPAQRHAAGVRGICSDG